MEEVIPAEQLTLKRCLGRGGFAIVYAGFYNVDGRKEPVAIKVLCPSEENQGGEDPTAMFLREARQTKRQQHEHIIRCFGLARIPPNHPGVSGISKTAWAMVLELAEPYTTKTLITQGMTDNRRTYTNLQAYTWLTQLASALAHLHSHRPPIIHRDIKQENLLLKKVTRPPPAAAAAAGGGVPAGAQRLPGGGGGTQLEAKLADLGLHVVVEQDRSVMLRRKSRYGSNHTGGNNRSVHNRSMHGSNRSAHGGGSVPGGTDSPFLAVSAAPSAAPSAMPSRAPSEYGIDLSGPFARVQNRLGVNGEGDEDSGAGGGGGSTGLGVSYASTGGGRISGGGGHQLSGAGGVWAGEDAGGGGAAAEGRRRRRRRISFDRDVKGISTDDEDGGVGSDSDSDSGGSNAGMSDEVDIVDIHGALVADSAPPTRPGTANLTAAAAAAAAAAPGTIAAAATASSTAAGGSSRHLPTSRLSRTSLLPAAGAAQPPQPSQEKQGQGQGQEPPGAQMQPSGSAAAIKPRAAAASVRRGRLPSPTAPPGAVQALRESGNSTLPMLGSPSGRRDVLPPLHWNDALFRAASHKHPDGSAGAAIHTLTDGGAGSGADSGFDDSPRPTADGDDGGVDGDGAGVGGVEGTRTSPANQGAALAQQLGGSSSRQLPPPVTKRPGYMGASGGEPGSVAVVSAGHNGSLAARPISASSQQQYATPRKSSSGGGGAAASSSALAAAAAAAAAAQDPSGGGAGCAGGGGGHPRMDLTVAVAEAADAVAAGLYSNTPLEPVETLMSPVPPGRMAAAAAGVTAGGSTVLAALAAMGTCGGLKGTGSSPGASWNAAGGGAAAVGSAHSAITAGRAGSGTNNYVGVAAAASSNTGVSTGPAGLPPMILEDYSYIGGLTDADAGGDDRELADNRPGVDFRCGVGQQQSGAAAAAGGGGASSGSAGVGIARQSSVSNIVLLPKDGAGPSSRPASKSRLGLPAVVNPLASMAVTAGGGGLGAGTASSQSTSRHCLAMSAPVSRLEMTPRAHQQTLQHPQAALAGVPPSLEHKDSFGTILNRNPELMVAPTGSFTSGLRRVHSVLSQFRQSELKQLRQSSLEWVFGLTGRAGSCMYMAPEVFRKLPYNEKADVFSFGVVMYELLSRELLVISYFNTSRGAKLGMHQPEDYAEMVCDGFRPARPGALANEAAWSLIEACWQDDPVQRPDMDTVLVRLRELQREEELHPTDPGGLMGCSCVIS